MLALQRQDLAQERLRAAKTAHALEEDRHMEMHAPFARPLAGSSTKRAERIWQVEVAREPVAFALDDLMRYTSSA